MDRLIRGIFASASGLINSERRLDAVANNIANADTPGFKRSVAVTKSFDALFIRQIRGGSALEPVLGQLGLGAAVAQAVPDMTQGGLRFTARALDLALEGEGFFAVQTPAGIRYTRDGSFNVDQEGYLVTGAGYRVVGTSGPVKVGNGQVSIDGSGRVLADGKAAGQLKVVAFPAGTLFDREGENLFLPSVEAGQASTAPVRSGYLETANVQPVREMVDMIAIMRGYEANQKVVRAQDETLGQAVNEIAKI